MPTNINMSELATGGDIDAIAASKLTGALPAISGASLTNLPASGVSVIAGAFESTSAFTFTPPNAYFYVWGCGGGGGSYSNGYYNAGGGGGAGAQAVMAKVACTANTSVSVAIGSGSSGNGGATTFTQGSVIASLGGGSETTYYPGGSGGSHSGFSGYVRSGDAGMGYSGLNGDQNPYGQGKGGGTAFTTYSENTSGLSTRKHGGEGGDGTSNNQAGTNGWAIVLY